MKKEVKKNHKIVRANERKKERWMYLGVRVVVQRTRMDGAYGFFFFLPSFIYTFFFLFGLIQNGRIFRVIIISTETRVSLYFVALFFCARCASMCQEPVHFSISESAPISDKTWLGRRWSSNGLTERVGKFHPLWHIEIDESWWAENWGVSAAMCSDLSVALRILGW